MSPVNVVKTEEDERHWSECKASVRKAHPELSDKDDRFYAMVMGCFKRRKGHGTTVVTKR